ncbi:MAG TPA: putative toxin-antitoxin system toxin component, PIN family [Lacipirellulaceae bacterium]|nr:putative toxin-antitoxin system toxin component, PIN family [Lacipirellulaceae bacterium]
MRIVLDTNLLLAGVATHGICEGLLAICFRDHSVVLSDEILNELAEHYVGKFKATNEQAAIVVDTLRTQSEIVEPAPIPLEAFADVDDLPILGTAVAGQAEFLITGDKQLVELGEYQGVTILSPREFYDRIRAGE